MSNASELDRLIFRLREVLLPTQRFLKLKPDKSPTADSYEWQNHPLGIDDLPSWSRWGVGGMAGLVLIDTDTKEMENIIREKLPPTFEVLTPRRKTTHFYYKVDGPQVENKILKIDDSACGEVRASNQYLVAPGTEIEFQDDKAQTVTGRYTIQADRKIAVLKYEDFMRIIAPLAGGPSGNKLTADKIEKGVKVGERHETAHRMAVLLVGDRKLAPDAALAVMREWNSKLETPIDDKDIVRSIKNAVKFVIAKAQPKVLEKQINGKTNIDDKLIKEMSESDTFYVLVEFLGKTIKNDPRYIHNVLMCAMSAYTTDPINCGSEAPTSEGKTYGFTEVLRIFPAKDVLLMGGMSPKALIHRKARLYDNEGNDLTVIVNKINNELAELAAVKGKNKDEMAIAKKKMERAELFEKGRWIIDLENTILVFLEAPSLETFMMLRPLMSHDSYETEYEYVDKDSQRTRKVILRGWPLVFYCKAGRGKEDIIWPEIKSRSILTTPAMNPEKYRAAVKLTAQRKGLPGPIADAIIGVQNIDVIRRRVELIKNRLLDITNRVRKNGYAPDSNIFWIPYYNEIGAEFPANVGKHMRDAKRFISMIQMSAAINVYARPIVEVDGVDYIICTAADYERAKKIFFEETGQEIFTGVPTHILKVFKDVIVPLCAYATTEKDGTTQLTLIEDKKEWRDVPTREIVDKSGISANTLRNHYLTVLEDAGLISSYPDPNDKRGKTWHIMKLEPDTVNAPKSTLFGEGSIFTPELLKKRLDELKTNAPAICKVESNNIDRPIGADELYKKYFVPCIASVSDVYHSGDSAPSTDGNKPIDTPTGETGVNGF